ncbi:MAG: 30S ribosomal protein S8 [Candidatus Nanoarchaeia archaeon]|jgi:small subunit ribosomal protein S8
MGDLISDGLSVIMNAERTNKKEVTIRRCSKLLINIVKIMKEHGLIGDYIVVDNNKGGLLTVKLINKINKVGSIRPRYPCKVDEIEGYEKVYLPASGFGIIIMSTPKGLITHYESKKNNTGGTLIAYCY